MKYLVTGGAGFIGSALCRHLAANPGNQIINFDKLTYAGNLASLHEIECNQNYTFLQADICDEAIISQVLQEKQIDIIINLAAESHVDRSIDGPATFINTNIVGTFSLLQAALSYWKNLKGEKKYTFRFQHVSTDEVFGDLPLDSGIFKEDTPYAPSSPYSASKASSDHLVRAWHHTYDLPIIISNCSNNYGPYQFPEKLIPLVILNALIESPLPIYGKGENIRDWLYVDDHARALAMLATNGAVGESYNIGGRAEYQNIEVVRTICDILDIKKSRAYGKSYRDLITKVADRPGHDRRYAIDPSKIELDLSWSPVETFNSGLNKTIDWYLENNWWWKPLRQAYQGERRGVSGIAV